MTEKFQIQFLEEAAEFLDNLEEKPRDKVIYNIHKSKVSNDKELFRKLQGEIWEFRTLFNKMYISIEKDTSISVRKEHHLTKIIN